LPRCLSVVFVFVALSFGIPQAVVIDDFTNPYPANPDLPSSGRQIIFVGSTCDGSSCPPNSIIQHLVSDAAYQSGLTGVIGGERSAVIYYVAGTANSNIIPSYGWMTMNHNAGASAILDLVYGEFTDLNMDFTPSASKFIVTVASGDMFAGPRPVPCTITVTSGRGTAEEATASLTLDLINEVDYEFPFSGFTGIDFSDVDMIEYSFDASNVSSVDFGIGPLRTDETIVPTEPSSWGKIKSLFE
jgi:hypothetical protein